MAFDRTYVRPHLFLGIERMFGHVGVAANPQEVFMELFIKVLLIGYVFYAVLGAPIFTQQR